MVRRGDFVLGPVSLQVDWGDRVVVTGANGSGKTTLLEVLLGRLAPDEGQVHLGPSVVVGEVDQRRSPFVAEQPLMQPVLGARAGPADRRGAHAARQVRPRGRARAAGGEHPVTRRTHPGRAGAAAGRGVNLLVLDEPTNHLDLPAILQARAGRRVLRRHARAGHARPADARHGAGDPAVARGRGPGRRARPGPRRGRQRGRGRPASG
nr:ATP-binding cassette domain-containing protein [Angustibacter aerolatus]